MVNAHSVPKLRLPRLPMPGVPPIARPPREGTVAVGRRRLGIAEYGDLDGPLVLWFHGTPGARRQFPPVGREAAIALGIHVVLVERPGTGASTPHRYRQVADVAADAAAVADHFGQERFAVVGLSGGGPYALACGAILADRVAGVGILGGVCPLVGPDAEGRTDRGLVELTDRFHVLLEPLRAVLPTLVRTLFFPILPAGQPALKLYASIAPKGDQEVFRDPGIQAMFLDDLAHAITVGGLGAIAGDIALFGADWGFRIADVTPPVRWWHGDADNFVDLVDAQRTAALLPDVEVHVRPEESHLGGFAAADDVLEAISRFLH
jgi:pimeloyl-ACP methyl ester carboxylesterase